MLDDIAPRRPEPSPLLHPTIRYSLKHSWSSPYVICVMAGLVLGFFAGDLVFPYVETQFGDLLGDIALAVVGGVFAAIACEVASELRAVFLWLL